MTNHQRDHAIVIGGSIGGLITAGQLASRFAHVTILERHGAPDGPTSIAPHGRYPHVLLDGGGRALERMLPGVLAELRGAGAPEADRDTVRWWSGAWRTKRATDTGKRVIASRDLVESVVRARVAALPNVEIRYRSITEGLVTADNRVVGVRTQSGELGADLVVDCAGRGSRAAEWLGHRNPPTTELAIDLSYLFLTLRRQPADLGGNRVLVVQNMAPQITRMGLALAVEGDRWLIVLGGYFGDMPPADRTGYLAFARSLPVPDLAQLIESCDVLAEPLPYRFRSSRRVHFERMRMPSGFVVLGDAMCSFNPLFGQGMTVAALQAEQLGAALDRGSVGRVQRDLAAIANRAWTLAAGADLSYPQVVGKRSFISNRIRRHMTNVFRACAIDGHVVDAIVDVTNLVSSPGRLLSPAMFVRVMRANARQREHPRADGVRVAI